MNEAQITVIGWLAADPRYVATSTGTPLMSLRVGCTPRRFDRESGQWHDMESTFLTVNCWRGLAENVNASDMKRGDPVIVSGRLSIREYLKDEQIRFSAVVDATTIGHDLTRGSAQFRRMRRGGVASLEDRREAEELNDIWLDSAPTGPDPAEAPEAPEAGGIDVAYPEGGAAGSDEEGDEPGPYDVDTKAA
ncbi:MAG TPA: single-stranded DNA-binding protein [Streptosporangiaceae bacterium]|nr:single-stranded DNA-binding protein [Streptosporangiaceae bacterium]